MSVIDKVIAAVTPPESDEARAKARMDARGIARPGDWLSLVLDHHEGIEGAFAAVKAAGDSATRTARLKELAVLRTGHAQAEESVIYPALAEHGEKAHAAAGYEEQSMVKIQMALLENIDPMSQDFIDKLEHIEGAVAHHVYAEEKNWFADLKDKAESLDQAKITQRYTEEYERYMSGEAVA